MFENRINQAKKLLKEFSADMLFINDPESIKYLTGLYFSLGRLFISGKSVELVVDGRYFSIAKKLNFLNVTLLEKDSFKKFIKKNDIKKIGFDSSFITYLDYENIKKSLEKEILVPINNPLQNLRLYKDKNEIALIKKSCEINWQGFLHISKLLKEGISEIELALEYEIFVKKHGAEKLSFDPIIAFGKNSAFPHHKTSNTKLKSSDNILIDIGVSYQGYASDMTRVVFLKEKNKTLEKYYEIIKEASFKAIELCRPNVKLKELDIAARIILKQNNIEHLFVHSLGHGVGLNVHEFPRIKFDNEDKDVLLKDGMVITIEPGLYDESIGGVRYENMILITQDSHEVLYPLSF
ncbi:MAG: hypothetical protein A3F40_00155 [Chlamydiae bacterium RIFCSPHIGHO2_12_FULL_27_8]|nr:MAG: hypothetical protein A3F40_00155 [Chlamydiae bacterium RIFCSPHIGHO2_12_FULL_27_8]